ncbi:MAG: hypothetical protein KME17_04620 [Cyanosarcina radialis HA8281-LM2]|jgi:hypothetical protein|nr:hypothetical protein [Cyanosarcina radialis HA8281-LM2]
MNCQTSFLSLICGTAIAISIVSPSSSNPAPSVEQKLLGTWQATVREIRGTFVFAPDNQLFLIEGDSPAIPVKYQINTQTKPMQLDLTHRQEKVLTIFELTDDNKLRIELEEVAPGKTRPKSFSSESVVFQKVSDSTSLPPDTRVQRDEDIYEDEAKYDMRGINKAQTIYRKKNSTFGDSLERIGLSILSGSGNASETNNNYSYKLVVTETEKTMATGIAKIDGLKSYVGIVYRYKNSQGKFVMSSVVCESNEPTKTVPKPQLEVIPKAPPTCPSGYSEVQF